MPLRPTRTRGDGPQVLYGVNQRLRVEDVDSPLCDVRPVKTVLLTILTGDRGLCGGYNNFIIKKVRGPPSRRMHPHPRGAGRPPPPPPPAGCLAAGGRRSGRPRQGAGRQARSAGAAGEQDSRGGAAHRGGAGRRGAQMRPHNRRRSGGRAGSRSPAPGSSSVVVRSPAAAGPQLA
jgi:hypothetical protein